MTNTSDGGKRVPPDPTDATVPNDTLMIHTPGAHSPKNDSILTGTDQDTPNFNNYSSPTTSPNRTHPEIQSLLNNIANLDTDNTNDSAFSGVNNDAVSPNIDKDMNFFEDFDTDIAM